ncbi:hypothetical protein GJ744_012309 [Endocarpon pusillum]|uniref:Arb2 domain-containing protein n=1 Tax=Endocarpon pusillum TaxID=364733 RepID=A0A8H7AFE0_9EURO|nr:hypothetical protein GJ744_012309 [Endocarpon pusillum]
MSQFRAKRLDIGGFVNSKIIRDHTKRKVFEQHEPESYFINQHDQIRMISHPTESYHYKINHRERINELYKEAHNTCIRHEILNRLHSLNLHTLRLPLNTPESCPHIPILASPDLSTAKRVVVYFGERNQDLGIFAYRIIGGDDGINAGSAVDFVKGIQSGAASGPGDEEEDAPAIVIANPGQLIWCRSQGRAMGRTEWENLPMESAVHPGFRLDEETGRNLVEGNRDEVEHVEYVFEHVLRGAGGGSARIDVIGSEWTGAAVVRYLGRHWSTWSTRTNGICLIAPLHGLEDLLPHSPDPTSTSPDSTTQTTLASSFADFISTRCRAYVVDKATIGTLVEGRAEFGCNVYASGEQHYVECIIIRAWRHMLDWFGRLSRGEDGVEEKWEMPESELRKESGEEEGHVVGKVDEMWAPDFAPSSAAK